MRENKFSNFVVRFAWLFIILFFAITAVFATQLKKVTLDTEMKNQLPDNLPTRLNLDRIEKLFGGTDMAMIVVSGDDILKKDTLERVKKLSKEMERVKAFDRVLSIFTAKDIQAGGGAMRVKKAIKKVPTSEKKLARLRDELKNNELIYGNLLSKDFKHTAIIGFLKTDASDEAVVAKLEKIVKDNPGKETTYVGGMPIVRVSLTKDIRKDMKKFLPIGLALMVVFLFICFRQARGVLLPFLMTVMAIIVVIGLIPLLGWRFHMVTVILPVILLAVANNYGIHIMARYQEDNTEGNEHTNKTLAKNGIVRLTNPVLATGITTMAGLLCLMTHIIIPAEQLGILATVGVAFAMVGSLVFIPAILAILPKAKPIRKAHEDIKASKGVLDKLMLGVADRITRRPKTVIIAFFAVALAMGLGAVLIIVDTNPLSFYHQEAPIWKSTKVLNKNLGGWANISVVVEGNIKDPKVMKAIDKLESHLQKHPLVGNTTSVAKVMRKMNEVMNGGDPKFNKVPDDQKEIAEYFMLYSLSAPPKDFNKIVDPEFEHAQVIAQVKDSGTRAATEVVEYTKAYLAKQQKGGPFKLVGGFLDVMANLVEHIVRGQLLSLFLSIVICSILVALLMRSVVAGVIAMMPLSVSMAMLFGIMGYMGIELNLITAMLSSIMVGVGIDYTIHFLWRYRDERRLSDPVAAVRTTLTTTGRGIVFNALSVVIGFIVLVISAFFPVRFFGLLVVVSITACLVCALVLLPAVVLVFKPRFLEPKTN